MIYFILAGIMITLFIAFCAGYEEMSYNCVSIKEYVLTYLKAIGIILLAYLVLAGIIGVVLLFLWLVYKGIMSYK